MKNSLNTGKLHERAQEMGLSQAKIAAELDVSRESVSQWFKNEKYPRPDKLLKLARILNLSFADLVLKAPAVDEPVVAFRRKGGRKITDQYIEQARDMGRILTSLVPYLPFDDLAAPPVLKAPTTEYAYVQKAAKRVRAQIGVNESSEIAFTSLIRFFNDLHAVIIPVLWGNRENHENALHIYLPESMTTWIYLNLDCRIFDFKYWMSHELGHVYAPTLREDQGEDFAEAFAGALLVPEELAGKEYAQLRRAMNIGAKINLIKAAAERFVVSPLTVYYEINKFAKHQGLPKIDLESNGEIFRATTNFNSQFSSISQVLFGEDNPKPSAYIASAKETFGSPFFEVLKEYLARECKSASFIRTLLNIPLVDAQTVFEELS